MQYFHVAASCELQAEWVIAGAHDVGTMFVYGDLRRVSPASPLVASYDAGHFASGTSEEA